MARPVPALVGVALLLAVGGCGDELRQAQEAVRPVEIFEVGPGGGGGRRTYRGTIRPSHTAELGFEVKGRLVDFPVQDGQQVEAGAVLAKIDRSTYEASVEQAQADLDEAKSGYDRVRERFDRGSAPQSELRARQRRFEAAAERLRRARRALDETVLRAPFQGTIARRLAHDLEDVEARQPVVELEDAGSLEIEVDLPVRDVGPAPIDREQATARLRPRVRPATVPDEAYPARVKQISLRPELHAFRVTLAFERPATGAVQPGTKATVSIRPAEAGGPILLPLQAVLSEPGGKAFVWRVDPTSMKVSRVPVQLGEKSGGEVRVRSGLSDGDWVVTSDLRDLREGMQVSRWGG